MQSGCYRFEFVGKRTNERNWVLFHHLPEMNEESHEKSHPPPLDITFDKILIFWDVTSCRLVYACRRFGKAF